MNPQLLQLTKQFLSSDLQMLILLDREVKRKHGYQKITVWIKAFHKFVSENPNNWQELYEYAKTKEKMLINYNWLTTGNSQTKFAIIDKNELNSLL